MAVELSINIDVDDLDRAIAFYADSLGLTLRRRLFRDVAEMAGAHVPVFLLEMPSGSAACADIRRDYRRHWTPVHLDIATANIEAALSRALAAGARQEGETAHHAWGHVATLSDPFGNGFCLIQFVGRGYDEPAAQ